MTNLEKTQQAVAEEMRHLAKTLRQLSTARGQFSPADLMTLSWSIRDLQRQVYDLAERLDLLDGAR